MEEKTKQSNRQYLSYIADRIATERPSSEVILQTLIDMEERGYGRGYIKRGADGAKFKEFQRKRREESWNGVKNHIEDLCSKEVPVNGVNNQLEE